MGWKAGSDLTNIEYPPMPELYRCGADMGHLASHVAQVGATPGTTSNGYWHTDPRVQLRELYAL